MKKIILFTLFGMIGGFLAFSIGVAYWFQHPKKNLPTIIMIEKGSSLSQVVSHLSKSQLVDFPFFFKGFFYLLGNTRQLKAGEYLIPASVTPAQLIHILKGGNVILHPVTLIEGETSHHLTQKLLEDTRFQGMCESPPEGSLLPETYTFPRGTERQQIVARMQKAMNDALAALWTQRPPDHPLKSVEEVRVLASIVEKETAIPQERPLVAAVFVNRLKQGMPLQADPTILYAFTKGERVLGRDLTLEDLHVESPYNTYLNLGLPPTPIANPSLASLKAVLEPADVPYIYFVANGLGGHVFATTLAEHQKNHAIWRKVRAKAN
jgi:UPF0755 protein